MPDDRYVMRLSVCHETYSIEEFDLQFKRNTDRDGLPEGEAYGGFITCTLIGMPGDELLRWAAYSHSREDGEIRIYQKGITTTALTRASFYSKSKGYYQPLQYTIK